VGRKQLEELVKVLQGQLAMGRDGLVSGSWSIAYDKERDAFVFDKCEFGGYCEERPVVIAAGGTVIDRGGPLLDG
jgi:hypothetical protein